MDNDVVNPMLSLFFTSQDLRGRKIPVVKNIRHGMLKMLKTAGTRTFDYEYQGQGENR